MTEDAEASHTPEPAPTSARERLFELDVLRGFALFGIAIVNVFGFALPLQWQSRPFGDSASRLVSDLVELLFTAKFYHLFSLLFGAGVAMLERRNRGSAVLARRLLFLLAIGVVHASFVWYGDILHVYAVLGFLLLLTAGWSATKLFTAAVAAYVAPMLLVVATLLALSISSTPAGNEEGRGPEVAAATRAIEVYRHGTFADVTRQRLADWGHVSSRSIPILPQILAMFLLGTAAVRGGWLERIGNLRRSLAWISAGTFAIGFPAAVYWTLNRGRIASPEVSQTAAAGLAAFLISGPLLSLSYACAITLLLQHPAIRTLAKPIAAAGRMGLTNYLAQSLLFTFIFYSHGFALYARIQPPQLVAIATAIYVMLVIISEAWLRIFRFGPAEWLWRSVTYGRRQPFLK